MYDKIDKRKKYEYGESLLEQQMHKIIFFLVFAVKNKSVFCTRITQNLLQGIKRSFPRYIYC